MPGLPQVPPNIRTVHLGQFTAEHADQMATAFEERGIVWWSKEPGGLSRFWQLGVEMFVDRERLVEAQELARSIIGDASAV
jgi:hypothetical protein